MADGLDAGEEALRLADAALAVGDVEGTVTHLSAAVRALTAIGDVKRTAMACVRLGDALVTGMGNAVAGRAWFARATRMLEGLEPCVEQGWAAIAAMGCDVGDPAELLAAAELALDRARRFGDVNLETKALADAGLAHVQAGRIDQGMALLDEAMALACGPADDIVTCGKSACSFFTACYYSGDFARAESWATLLRRHHLMGPVPGAPVFLSNHCDAVHASLLIELGRWSEAEALLQRASEEFETTMGVRSWHPSLVLADLRVRQGRLTDAETLLLGKDYSFEALLPMARLHLARREYELARAAARRGLRSLGDDRLRAIELLTGLVHAELGAGDVEAATRACEQLRARAGAVDVAALRARAMAATAAVVAAAGDEQAAIALLDDGITAIDRTELPWLRATLLLELAARRERVGDLAGAAVDAKAAAAALASLDVTLRAEDATLLARLTAGSGHPDGASAATATATLRRDGRWWVAEAAGTSVRLPDTKGLRYLAELVGSPGAERHALDLVDRVEGVERDGVDRHRLGDAGEVLDVAARTAYRRRIEALRDEAEEALAAGQLERAEALERELQELVAQLAAAFGLGGRDRRAASAAERARLNVTRALRTALAKLTDALGEAGAVLDRHIRTGTYSSYEPVAGEIRWIVQS